MVLNRSGILLMYDTIFWIDIDDADWEVLEECDCSRQFISINKQGYDITKPNLN